MLNASIVLAINYRDISDLDALQCKLVNVLYPLATYHPPSKEAEWSYEYLLGGVPMVVLVIVGGCFHFSIHLDIVPIHRAQLLAPQLISVDIRILDG